MPDIVFTQGAFQKFRFKTKVHLGGIKDPALPTAGKDMPEGAIIEFDGQIMRYAGTDYPCALLVGGIRAGWLVPVDDGVSRYVPQPAGVEVRPAQSVSAQRGAPVGVMPVSQEEAFVGSVDQTNQRREEARVAAARGVAAQVGTPQRPQQATVGTGTPAANAGAPAPFRRAIVAEEPAQEIRRQFADPTGRTAAAQPQAQQAGAVVLQAGGEAVEADTVATFRTSKMAAAVGAEGEVRPPRLLVSVETSAQVQSEINRLENMGSGTSRAAATPTVARTPQPLISRPEAPPSEPPLAPMTRPSTTVIHRDAEHQDIMENPGGVTGDVQEARAGDDLTDLLPDAATSGTPRPGVVEQGADGVTRLQWDMGGHWQSRVKKAVEMYGNDVASMRQVLEQETPAVAKQIRAELDRRAAIKKG